MRVRLRGKIRTWSAGALLLVMAVLIGGYVLAGTAQTVRADDQYVKDGDDLFSDEEERRLEEKCEEYHERNGMNFFVLTVTNADVGGSEDYDTQKYIEDYADAVYAGQDAFGVIINMDIRYYYLDIRGDNALPVYTDSRQKVLEEKLVSKLKTVEYYQGIADVITLADKYAQEGPGEASGTEDFGVSRPEMLAALVLGVVGAFIVLGFSISKHHEKKMAVGAHQYIPKGGFHLAGQRDVFVRQYVTKTAKQSSSSSGGTTTHRSSSGSSHSGRGGHF